MLLPSDGCSRPREVRYAVAIDADVSRQRAWKFGKPGPDLGKRPRGKIPGEAPNDRNGVRARQVERGLERRLFRLREANERLVVAAVRAQTLSEEAETACHLKDEFLAALSHEIRTVERRPRMGEAP
jgi:signal transduction histidine kinase